MVQWIRYGVVPESLNEIARKSEFETFAADEIPDDLKWRMDDLQDWVVSQIVEPKATVEQVRGLRNTGTEDAPKWAPVPDAMPKEDRDDLWGVARRVFVPRNEFMAMSQFGPVGEMVPFRDGSNGSRVPRDKPSTGRGPSPRRGSG
jgi:hypothetical protein